jgi:hypothetical protein
MPALWIVIVFILAIVVLWFMMAFNGLAGTRNACATTWTEVNNVLQKRRNLVAQVLAIARGRVAPALASQVESAIQKADAAQTPAEQTAATTELIAAVAQLAVVTNLIAYNDAVRAYEAACESFPGNLVRTVVPGSFPDYPLYEVKPGTAL